MSDVLVKTTSGTVRGVDQGGITVFRGVPYGDDTSGDGRFRPPRPPRAWNGVRDCVEYGPSCPQMTVEQMLGMPMADESEAYMGTQNYERSMGEDCLVLNVWTPGPDASAARPVLVWLHGGGWSTGSASWPLYDFTNLAARGDAVVVGLNHRVGILGFLDLSAHGPEFADSGNAGMLDIVAALEWIRDNIAGFGGDPGNVTVFGESGGGAKVATLLGMPAARGLFHQASAMSGSMLLAQERDVAAENTAAVLDSIGSGLEQLLTVEAGRFIEAEIELPGRQSAAVGAGRGFSPVLGPSLPQHPGAAVRDGLSIDVTLVSGCLRDEMMAFLFHDPDLWTLELGDVVERLRPSLGDGAEEALAAYRSARPDLSPTSLLIAITTDAMFRVPQLRLAEAQVAAGGQAYMYLFTWGITDPNGETRAAHGVDMAYFFDNVDKAPMMQGPQAEPLTDIASGMLLHLAAKGEPGHPGLPSWPSYSLEERATMLLDLEPTVELDPFGAGRACWDGIELSGLRA